MSLSVTTEAGVTIIRLPDGGTMRRVEDLLDLNAALLAFDADDRAGVAILHAEQHFWPGLDRAALRPLWADMADLKGKLRHFSYPLSQSEKGPGLAWVRLLNWRVSKPVIAAIEGDCVDHGMAILGVHTDLRVAAAGARFGFPAIAHGDAAGEALVSRLAEQISPAALNWMVETAELIDAAHAERSWLVNEVVPDGDTLIHAKALAAAMLEIPPQRLRAEKLSARLAASVDPVEAVILAVSLERGASMVGPAGASAR